MWKLLDALPNGDPNLNSQQCNNDNAAPSEVGESTFDLFFNNSSGLVGDDGSDVKPGQC